VVFIKENKEKVKEEAREGLGEKEERERVWERKKREREK